MFHNIKHNHRRYESYLFVVQKLQLNIIEYMQLLQLSSFFKKNCYALYLSFMVLSWTYLCFIDSFGKSKSHYTIFCIIVYCVFVSLGESIPIRLFLSGYELTPTMRDINKKFSVRYYLNLVLVDEEERRYFKQQVKLKLTIISL